MIKKCLNDNGKKKFIVWIKVWIVIWGILIYMLSYFLCFCDFEVIDGYVVKCLLVIKV